MSVMGVLIVSGTLSACGNGGSLSSQGNKPVDALTVVTAAQSASQKAGSAKMAMTMEMSAAGQSFTMRGEGAFDFAKQLGQMSMSMPNPDGSGDLSFDEVITDTMVYIKSPMLAGAGKPWVGVDLKEAVGGSLSQLSGGSDPTSGLEMLAGAKSVTTVGKETIRGTETTHYKAVVDINKAMAGKPEAVRAKLQGYQKALGAKFTDLPVEVWIDKDNRPAKFSYTMDMPATEATGNQPFSMTMSIEMFDYGTPVTVTVPPASDVSIQSGTSLGG
jgi:hypothetical protein